MHNQLRAVILMGSPCAGKTTYALSDVFSGFDYIAPSNCSKGDARMFIERSMRKNRPIVIDDCNATLEGRKVFIDLLKADPSRIRQYQIECHEINIGMRDVRDNARTRQSRGGHRLNKSQFIKYRHAHQTPSDEEGFSVVIQIDFVRKGESEYKHAAVFFSLPSVCYSKGTHSYHCPSSPEDVGILPDVSEVLRKFAKQHFKFVLLAGIPEIGDKAIAETTAQDCIIEVIKKLPVPIDDFFYSQVTSLAPAMVDTAKERHGLDLSQSIMVGHSDVEKVFAKLAGFGKYLPRDKFFWNGKPQIQEREPEDETKEAFEIK